MIQISADFLTLTSEAAVLIQHGKISFANSAACDIIGNNCVGKSVQALFEADIAYCQAPSFIGDVPICGKHYIVRVTRIDGVSAIFFSRSDAQLDLLCDAFIYSLRSSLMSFGICMEMTRLKAEELHDEALLSQVASLSLSFFKIQRVVSNATVIRGLADHTLFFGAQEINLGHMFERLTDALRLITPSPEVRLSVPDNIVINADPSLLEQMMLNLISNCLVHAKGCTRVSINVMDLGEKVMISVDDDGCGIAPEELHSVFDRFRHNSGIASMSNGTGLGLTVARMIAQLHGGTLLLESRVGKGTTVRASISKHPVYTSSLHTGHFEYSPKYSDIKVGIADSLTLDSFSEGNSD